MDAAPRQHQLHPVALGQLVPVVQAAQRMVGPQVQPHAGPARRLDLQPTEGRTGVAAPARLEVDPERDGAVEHLGQPHQLAAAGGRVVREVGAGAQRQRVGEPQPPRRGAQLGLEHAGVGLIALPRIDGALGRHVELPAFGAVQQLAEQRLGVEARDAEPGNAAVQPDERGRRAVADESQVLQRQEAAAPAQRAQRRCEIKHSVTSAWVRRPRPGPCLPGGPTP
jgi:hypothetical protein